MREPPAGIFNLDGRAKEIHRSMIERAEPAQEIRKKEVGVGFNVNVVLGIRKPLVGVGQEGNEFCRQKLDVPFLESKRTIFVERPSAF